MLTMDCDFQHLLPEFRDLLDGAAEGYDVVIGSRFSRHSVLLNYPFMKILANRAFHAIAVVLFGRRIRDVTNNLKIMRREVVQDLRLRQRRFCSQCRDRAATDSARIWCETGAHFLDQPHTGNGSIFLSTGERWRRLLEGVGGTLAELRVRHWTLPVACPSKPCERSGWGGSF